MKRIRRQTGGSWYPAHRNLWTLACAGVMAFLVLLTILRSRSQAVEIPLDTLTPVRIGYIDLQRVFDTYPEKSFAEGDLLREIEKRKRELGRRQTEISALRQQIASDQAVIVQARTGIAVVVPPNTIPEPVPEAPKPPPPTKVAGSSTTVVASSATVEPYPTEDPLAGLPGHDIGATPAANTLPGLQGSTPVSLYPHLDLLSAATGPVLLDPTALGELQKRIDVDNKRLDKDVAEFKMFRTNAVDDMKQLQTQKTYGVMSKIYAVLQQLARDENITVVLDKSYVLFGEDTVDLSDKLISRLQQESL